MASINKAVRRLNADIREYRAGPIEGTAVYQCEDPMTRIYIAIAGPKDSAYQDGIYYFQFDFPDSYPNDPPKGKFLNWQNSKTRMHPNLYVDGKLCLSILGTWSGPSWTSAMSITTIILAIQSILDENPLKNEPGYDKNSKSEEHMKYHRIVQSINYRDFVIKTMESTYNPASITDFPYVDHFKDFVVAYYLNNWERVQKELLKLKELYPDIKTISTGYQACSTLVDYYKINSRWNDIYQLFLANL